MQDLSLSIRTAGELRGNLLADLFDKCSDLVQVINTDGSIKLVNASWCNKLGYREEEALTMNIFSLIAPDCQENCQLIFRDLLSSGQPKSIKCAFLTREGNRIYLEGNMTVVMKEGVPVMVQGILRDVSERHHSEQAILELNASLEQKILERTSQLRVSEQRLEEAQRVAKVGHWDLDMVNYQLYWSDEIYRILCLDKDTAEATYEFFLSLAHPDDRQLIDAAFWGAVQTGVPYDITYRVFVETNRMIYLRTRCAVYFHQDGSPLRAIGTSQDVTELITSRDSLINSQTKLRKLVELSPLGIALIDDSGRYLDFNDAFLEIVGHSAEELCGLSHSELFTDYAKGEATHRLIGPNGEGCLFKIRVQPLMSEEGSFSWLIVEDVTQRLAAEKALRQAANVFRHAQEGIMITDQDGVVLDVNEAFSKITGYERAEVIGSNPRLLKSGFHPPQFYQDMWARLNDSGSWTGEVVNRAKDGALIEMLETISAVSTDDDERKVYVALMADIRQIKSQQRQLEHLAHFDQLTGLPNRVGLSIEMEAMMDEACRQNAPISICYIDLDGFKEINDYYGHAAGDALLRCLADRIRLLLSDSPHCLARLGGDEFVVVLGHQSEALILIEKLLYVLSKPVDWGHSRLEVSASIGIVQYPDSNRDQGADQLLRFADQAMYRAKQMGKNRYALYNQFFYNPASQLSQ
jgi:diguanylate cyclase (GGDEF)-like protein/PAS domain S-box-containing protein